MTATRSRPPLSSLLLFFAVYVLTAGLGQGLAIIPGVSVTFWPPAGIFVAMLLVHARERWTFIVLVAALAELTANLIWFHNALHFALLYFAANACEAMLAAYLIGRVSPPPFRLASLRDVVAFVLLAGLTAPLLGATIIAGIDAVRGKQAFSAAFQLVWLGDGSGLLVSTPLALVIAQGWRARRAREARTTIEAVSAVLTLLLVGVLAFQGAVPTLYLTLPPLLWLAARFGVQGASVGVALLTLLTAAFVVRDGAVTSVSATDQVHQQMVMLQMFLMIAVMSSLVVGALAVQHQKVLADVQAGNATLEARVAERTASLRESEERFRLAADAVNGVIYDADLGTGRVERSRGLLEVLGYDPGLVPATAHWWSEQIHPDDRERAQELGTPPAGSVVVKQYRARHHDGRWIHLEDRAVVLTTDDGTAVRLVGCIIDITARKLAEQERAESLAQLNSLIASAPVGIVLFDHEMRFQHINTVLAEINGVPADAHLGRTVADVVPDLSAAAEALFRQVVDTGATIPDVIIEGETPRTPGAKRVWRETWFPVLGPDDTRAGVGAIVTEITEQRLAEERLQASEQRQRLATAATGVGVWEWNVLSGNIRWDQQMFHIYGLTPTPDGIVPYAQWSSSLVSGELARQEAILEETRRHGGTSRREFRITRANDGAQRIVQAVETARANAKGEVEWVVGTNLDVTDLRESEEELRRLAESLSEADQRKTLFLATLAHELRNPLAPLMNGLELLKMVEGGAVADRTRAMMERQLVQLVRLVDDLMDVSRISKGKLALRTTRLDLRSVLEAAMETSAPGIAQAQHRLDVAMPAAPVFVRGDATRLTQAVANLLNNSTRYMPDGGRIRLSLSHDDEWAQVTVADEGIGMSADMLERVFDMFTQGPSSGQGAAGGLGIGLSLVKGLVELHGGKVVAHSDGEGRGSRFTVRLPLLVAEPA
jgi:PAS domain S-box-containing protein